jgi:hypothetical protein
MIAINRFDTFLSPEEPLSGSIFLGDKHQPASLFRREIRKK